MDDYLDDPRRPLGPWSREALLDLWNRPLRLFRLARFLREECSGDFVSFVINRNINFTNECIGTCSFCSFKRFVGFRLSLEEILQRAASAEELGATEICIQGGLAHGMVLEEYCEILETIRSHHPRFHLHAYSPMEVVHMSRNSGVLVKDALKELKDSGLGSMPGTAAEILVDEVRRRICPQKLNSAEWIRVVKTAHNLGIPTTSTMLYGHVESLQDRLRHLELLRQIQQETGGFTEFVLLPFVPGNSPLSRISRSLDLLEHLKMHALARVALHPYIHNIQASWVKLGRGVAGATLEWGVNDLGGTLMEENISRSAGCKEAQYISPQALSEIIEAHGFKAVQRTTLYRHI
jgi:FO synthase subunit 2